MQSVPSLGFLSSQPSFSPPLHFFACSSFWREALNFSSPLLDSPFAHVALFVKPLFCLSWKLGFFVVFFKCIFTQRADVLRFVHTQRRVAFSGHTWYNVYTGIFSSFEFHLLHTLWCCKVKIYFIQPQMLSFAFALLSQHCLTENHRSSLKLTKRITELFPFG